MLYRFKAFSFCSKTMRNPILSRSILQKSFFCSSTITHSMLAELSKTSQINNLESVEKIKVLFKDNSKRQKVVEIFAKYPHDFARNSQFVRILNEKIGLLSVTEIDLIIESVSKHFDLFMESSTANYLLEDLLNFVNTEERLELIGSAFNNYFLKPFDISKGNLSFAISKFFQINGCQKYISKLEPKKLIALAPIRYKLVLNLMEHLTYKDNKNLIDYICDNFLSLSKGKYESFVVENLIKANNDNEIKLKIEQAILDNISEMIKNIYSVYVFRTYSKQLNNSAKPINHLFETGFEINSSMPSRTLVRMILLFYPEKSNDLIKMMNEPKEIFGYLTWKSTKMLFDNIHGKVKDSFYQNIVKSFVDNKINSREADMLSVAINLVSGEDLNFEFSKVVLNNEELKKRYADIHERYNKMLKR